MPILRRDLLFIHIPKTGGSAVEVAAGLDEQFPQLGLAQISAQADPERLFGGGLEHLSIREIRSYHSEVFAFAPRIFSVIRDPVDRFVSHFAWRFYRFNDAPPPVEEMLVKFQRFAEVQAFALREHPIFLDPFDGIDYGGVPGCHLNDESRHLLPQCAFLFDKGECAVDEIFHIGQLGALERMLHREYGFSAALPRRMVTPASAILRKHIPDDTEELIRSLYSADVTFVRETEEACKKISRR